MSRKEKVIILFIWIAAILTTYLCSLPIRPAINEMMAETIQIQGDKSERFLYLHTDATMTELRQDLLRERLIQDIKTFDKAAGRIQYKKVRPGKYLLYQGMSLFAFLRDLNEGRQEPVVIRLHHLHLKEEVADILANNLEVDKKDVLRLLGDKQFLSRFGANETNTMAFFIGGDYTFSWNTTAEKVLQTMFSARNSFWTEKLRKKAMALGLSPAEVMALASIVQEEVVKKKEAPAIAGVYLNRLRVGMRLQADPTIKYIRLEQGRGRPIHRIYNYDLDISSAYNTYQRKGLPPGPIVIPEDWAVEAVLSPEKHDYLFFVAKDDLRGYHIFTKDFTEHNYYSQKYRQALDRREIH